jgi:hypothetical protein
MQCLAQDATDMIGLREEVTQAQTTTVVAEVARATAVRVVAATTREAAVARERMAASIKKAET